MLSLDSRFSAPRPARRAIASRERAWHARCARTIGVLSRARDFAHARAGGGGGVREPSPPSERESKMRVQARRARSPEKRERCVVVRSPLETDAARTRDPRERLDQLRHTQRWQKKREHAHVNQRALADTKGTGARQNHHVTRDGRGTQTGPRESAGTGVSRRATTRRRAGRPHEQHPDKRPRGQASGHVDSTHVAPRGSLARVARD